MHTKHIIIRHSLCAYCSVHVGALYFDFCLVYVLYVWCVYDVLNVLNVLESLSSVCTCASFSTINHTPMLGVCMIVVCI